MLWHLLTSNVIQAKSVFFFISWRSLYLPLLLVLSRFAFPFASHDLTKFYFHMAWHTFSHSIIGRSIIFDSFRSPIRLSWPHHNTVLKMVIGPVCNARVAKCLARHFERNKPNINDFLFSRPLRQCVIIIFMQHDWYPTYWFRYVSLCSIMNLL